MASLKRIGRVFACLLAILLMSHNTFAVDFSYNVRLYTTSAIRAVYDSSGYSNSNGIFVDTILAGGFQGEYNDVSVSDGMLVEVPVMVFNAVENNAVDGYVMADEVDCGYISCQLVGFTQSGGSSSTVFHFYLYISSNGTLNNISFTKRNGYALRLYQNERAVMPFISVFRFVDNSSSQPVVPDLSIVNDNLPKIYNRLNKIYDRLGDLSENIPSADEMAEAINAPEEQAAENISNQSSDDYEMQSANMSSLFSQFGNFITAVNGATIGDCTIPADFNHINLGILDLCKNPVPDYVQVAVSIVSCMIVAPYLMNIIKRILAIADKVREV